MNLDIQTQVALDLEDRKVFWERMLSRVAAASGLKPDYERRGGEPPVDGEFQVDLTGDLYRRLCKLAASGPFLLYTTLMAGMNVCLYRHTGNSNVVVGSPPRKRDDRAIPAATLLPIVSELHDRNSFQELLGDVRRTLLDAYAKQSYPLEQLAAEMGREKGWGERPLVELALVLKDIHGEVGESPDVVTITFIKEADRIAGHVRFNTRLFRRDTLRRFTDHYVRTLTAATAGLSSAIGELSLISEAEQFQLVFDWNDTSSAQPTDLCVHDLIEEQAGRTPDSIAVVFKDASLSYDEMNRRASQLARRLASKKIGPEAKVAIWLSRSPQLIVAILGVLKSGAAYIPIDRDWPADRLELILQDSGALLLLTDERSLFDAPEQTMECICLDRDWGVISRDDVEEHRGIANRQNLAYVMYTSGSTGRPKGVMISHDALVNYLSWCTEAYQVSSGRGAPVHSAIGFDLTVTSLLSPLMCGAPAVLVPDDQGVEGLALSLARLDDFSLIKITPSHLALLGQQLAPSSVAAATRAIVIGGEALLAESLLELRSCADDLRLINEYGPTETVVGCCVYEVPAGAPGAGPVPIGRPIANTQAHVLDGSLRLVPITVPGELCIGGRGLARGYLNHPDLTADKFIPNPISGEAGSRLYRTGDIALRLADGNLEFHGRFDNQVKVRGFRIELGEIETVISRHPGVREAVVLARQDNAKQRRIIAYWVANEAPGPADGELRRFLRERLPQWMIPSAFVLLGAFPLNSNGKIDRAALPEPEQMTQEFVEAVDAAPSQLEGVLVSIWSDVLGVRGLGVDADFFELGGHSLLATQVVSRVREAFGIAISLLTLFETPTPAGLAVLIERQIRTGLKLLPNEITRASRDGNLPLSFEQQRLWFLAQLAPESPAYNVPLGLRLTGTLSLVVLEQTLDESVRRHEVLRTSFRAVDGHAVQIIHSRANLTVHIVDLAGLSEEEEVEVTTRMAERESVRVFQLDEWPLIRVKLLRSNEQSHVALVTMHHIVCDGWSTRVLVTEVSSLYQTFSQGNPSPLPELEIQYADYATWQREWLQNETLANLVSYWKGQLAGELPILRLPTDHPRPEDLRFRGAGESRQISKETTERLKALSRRQDMTLFMTLLAAFKVLLHRYSGQDDIVVGTATANRNSKKTEMLMGFFVNMLVLRTDLSGNPTFREVLTRVRRVALGAFTQQDLPFEKLVAELQPERHLSHTPLLQVVFLLQNTPQSALYLPGLTLSPFGVGFGMTHFDLYMSMTENNQGLRATLEYNADLFESHTITRMLDIFGFLLERLSAEPDARVLETPLIAGEDTSFSQGGLNLQKTHEHEQFAF
jgi:amino acid adenylation domain-containing protein